MAKKKEKKSRLIVWLTNRYELIVRNEADFAERRTMTFTYAQVLFVLFCVFALMMGSSLMLTKTLLSEWFNPEYEFNKLKYEISNLADANDYLQSELELKDKYIMTFKKRLDPEYQEDVIKGSNISSSEELGLGIQDTLSNSNAKEEYSLDLAKEMLTFPVQHYNLIERDSSKEGSETLLIHLEVESNVLAIRDGIIDINSWDVEHGHVITISHQDGLKTVYHGLGVTKKKVGDFVNAGDIIALSGKDSKGKSIVKFEMWHKGLSLNAENYFVIKK